MTPPEHRALAETLADRVYRDTSDPQALAHIAVVHALLATGPQSVTYENVSTTELSGSMTWQGWLVLLLLLATVLGVVALVVR